MKKIKNYILVGAAAAVIGVGALVGVHKAETKEVREVSAATETTVYYAVPSDVVGTYNVRLNVNFRGDGDWWNQYIMEKTPDTLDGKDVYRCTYVDAYDGVGCMQFQLYNGDTYVAQQEPYSSWTGVGN